MRGRDGNRRWQVVRHVGSGVMTGKTVTTRIENFADDLWVVVAQRPRYLTADLHGQVVTDMGEIMCPGSGLRKFCNSHFIINQREIVRRRFRHRGSLEVSHAVRQPLPSREKSLFKLLPLLRRPLRVRVNRYSVDFTPIDLIADARMGIEPALEIWRRCWVTAASIGFAVKSPQRTDAPTNSRAEVGAVIRD